MSRSIGYETYKYYAKKYGIRLSYVKNGKRVKKNYNELQMDIFKYETENDIKKGLYYY
jgi:hypothetical protein